jgi:radical SAM superfamily enzyme YgiQ (UPF0313 family)
MRVLLIRPNSKLKATTLPIGMGYIADAARKRGHEVSLIDARLDRTSPQESARKVISQKPDVLGISAIHFEKHGVLELCRELKKQGADFPLVLGGPLVSTSGNELVKDDIVDAAIIGEGETAFNSYLDAFENNSKLDDIPGIIFKEEGKTIENPPGQFIENLDESLPAWDLINPERYFSMFGRSTLNMLRRSTRAATIFTSRGCPFGCLYCHNVFGKKFRARSPQSVIDEILLLKNEYDIKELEIVDDAFNVKLDRAKEIARRIIELDLGLSISFSNGLRADRMDEELIDLLKEAGTYRINYAVETATPRLQKLLHKNLDLQKTKDIIAYTADKGIFILGYFMFGFPSETEEEMMATIQYALDSKFHAAGFFYVNPFPGTPMAEQFPVPEVPDQNIDDMDYTSMTVNLSDVSDERLKQISKEAYRKFHFAPDRMWRTFKVVPKNLRTAWSVAIIAALSVKDVGNF